MLGALPVGLAATAMNLIRFPTGARPITLRIVVSPLVRSGYTLG